MRARGSRSNPGVRSRAVGGSVGQISHTAGPHPLSLGVCGNRILATIGADVIPPAKQQRALAGLTKLQTNRMTVEEADSLTGLLVHLAPFARDPSIMYNLHAPACRVRSRGPRARVNLTADEQLACSRWRAALVNHPAIFAIVVCQELDYVPDYTASTAWEMSSDAAKAGAIVPAVAGHMHGVTWSLPLSPDDVSGPRQISIPVLEFLAIVGNFKTFGPLIPTGVTLRVTSDSITSVDVCAAASAHTPQMQHLHRALLDDLHFQRLSPNALIAHIFGDDAVSGVCHSERQTWPCRQAASFEGRSGDGGCGSALRRRVRWPSG